MATVIKDLGGVTAYADAVAAGYTGTREEFQELMASYVTVAEEAAQSASDAEQAKNSAKESELSAKDYSLSAAQSASGASQSATSASQSATSASDSNTYAQSAKTSAETSALKSEGFAVGQQNGTDVSSDSPYYHNNAEYYAEQAAQSAATIPTVTSADNGKFNRVVDGAWAADPADDIARTTGYYDGMGVAAADQLISTVRFADTVPYTFRTAGGSADIGNRLYEKVVGGSIVWNQTVQNGNFVNDSGWSHNYISITTNNNRATLTMTTGVSTAAYIGCVGGNLKEGHRYYVSVSLTPSKNTSMRFSLAGESSDTFSLNADTRYHLGSFLTPGTSHWGLLIYVNVGGDLSEGDTVIAENVQCYDITKMFGETIADALYSEYGKNILLNSWFNEYFPKEFYAYNSGTLMSVQTSAHVTIGFNAFNPETGTANLLGGHKYQITGSYQSVSYESISGGNFVNWQSDGFIPESDGILSVTGAGDDVCVHLVWSGYRNGEFAEYAKHTYALDSALDLRGVAKLDSSLNLYYDGDIYPPNGNVERRYRKIVLDGVTAGRKILSNSQVISAGSGYYAYISLDEYGVDTLSGGGLISDRFITRHSDQGGYINIRTSGKNLVMGDPIGGLDTAQKWNEWLEGHNVTVVYELAESETEVAEAYTSPQIVDDFGTEEYVDYGVETGTRDVAIPVGHDSEYLANLRDKLQHLPDMASSDGNYVIRQVGTQMTLVDALETMGPVIVNVNYDSDLGGFYADKTNGEIYELAMEGRNIAISFPHPDYPNFYYMAYITVAGMGEIDDNPQLFYEVQAMDPFTSTFTVLFSMGGYDQNEWTFATYGN